MLGFDALGKLPLGGAPGGAAGATIFEDSWHQPFNTDIVRRRAPIPTGAHQFAAFVEVPPFDETFGIDRGFFLPLSEPVRKRPPMPTAAQQFASFVQFAPFTESVTADRWFVPFSEPTRFRPRLQTSLQQFASFVQFSPFYETVSADRWFVPFSEPVRFRPRLVTADQWFGRGIEFPLTGAVHSMAIVLLSTASISGVPTSNYKQILASDNKRKLVYAAEISPWTLST